MTTARTLLRLASFVVPALGLSGLAPAATITVNSSNNLGVPGSCVLRDAIQAANTNVAVNGCGAGQASPTVDTIAFAIPPLDNTVKILLVGTGGLPNITERVFINGYTQAGAVANSLATGSNATPKIYLDGTNAGAGAPGLTIKPTGGNSTVRGLVVARFPGGGILVDASSNNLIAGNFIGTDANGNLERQNQGFGGVQILSDAAGEVATGNTIGGLAPADRNLISINVGQIKVVAYPPGTVSGTTIIGNLIGPNKSGNGGFAAAPNGMSAGIQIIGASTTTVGSVTGVTPGGACTGGCNVIAGNSGEVTIYNDGASGTTIQANMIGVNGTGTTVVPLPPGYTNTGTGITISQVSGTTIQIGGTTVAQRNIIAGKTGPGIDIQNFNHTINIAIEGNYIGTDVTGTVPLQNFSGVHVQNNTNVRIGGTAAGAGNLISGNKYNGVNFEGGFGVIVQGNRIGPDSAGMPMGNGRHGVGMNHSGFVSPDNNIIGASTSGGPGGNIIAYNGVEDTSSFAGVAISSGIGNRISTNSIHDNGGTPFGLGIDLQGDGPTDNDTCDPDMGANDLQNSPTISSRTTVGGVTRIGGNMRGRPNTMYTLEFYRSPTGDPAGYGEGATYVGSGTVTTGNSPLCVAFYNINMPILVPANELISGIAIAPDGSTSEFSGPIDRIFADNFGL